MHSLVQDYPAVLFANEETPCLSLYQPTHRQHPDNVQDPIRFRNLVKEMAESLRQKYPKREIQSLLQPFEDLADNEAFWNNTADGLAVLGAPGIFRVYRLQRPVAELVVVADSFHTKPLMRITQSADRYQVLGLSSDSYKMFEGNRDALDEVHPIGGTDEGLAKFANIRHAAGDKEKFFRAVDQAVVQQHSKPSGLPLILAALPEHHGLFQSVSSNPLLMSEIIPVYPDAMTTEALRERAWELVQPNYLNRLAGLVDAYGAAAASDKGSDALGEVAKAAVDGRIATLLIEADRLIPGNIDAANGDLTLGKIGDPEVDDLLDDLGELVLRKGGEVVIVPAERMPTKSGAAATYRY